MSRQPASPRPFRFGLQVARPRPANEWKAIARRAEALGYDVFLMPDHVGHQFAIGPALATVAAVTSRIRIGTLVWQNDLRHPALVAMEAATLDILSDGRFEFGIGAGGSSPAEYDSAGIPFDPPGVRVSRLEESLRVFRALAAPDPLTHAGEYFSFEEYGGLPKPVQQPHPPIVIAGGGRRMLAIAAREADIVGIVPRMLPTGGFSENQSELDLSMESFAAKVRFVRERAGQRATMLEFNLLLQQLIVTDNRDQTIATILSEHPDVIRDWFDSPMTLVGTVEEIAARLRTIRDQTGISYFVAFEPMMEDFAPILEVLAGT